MPIKLITDFSSKSTYLSIIVRKISQSLAEKVANRRLSMFKKYLTKNILDIGLGGGSISKILIDKNFKVKNLDVTNTSLYPNIIPTIYNGNKFPYKNNEFDTGLLICVLHHCPLQVTVLQEAMRTCKRLVILEDTYRNKFEKILVAARDNVGNFEFYMHKYRSTQDWLKLFDKLNWKSIFQFLKKSNLYTTILMFSKFKVH